MPEAIVEPAESLGWRAGLTGDLQKDDTFKQFKGVSDLATDYLSKNARVTELQGKLDLSVPKLPDNATDAERNLYFDALGRPKTAAEYEFDGEDKNAPEWTNYWKAEFHRQGFTKPQAKALSAAFNKQIQSMVEANNLRLRNEYAQAETALKSEWGDKFDTNVELAKRLYSKHLGSEFDKDFAAGTDATKLSTIKLLFKVAQLTGEDRSPQSVQRPKVNGVDNPYPKSNMPPARNTSFPVIA